MQFGVDMVSVSRIAHSHSTSTKFAEDVFTRREFEQARRMPGAGQGWLDSHITWSTLWGHVTGPMNF
jgi:phosphopantetheinyl transferase (holo-ACP synthase)